MAKEYEFRIFPYFNEIFPPPQLDEKFEEDIDTLLYEQIQRLSNQIKFLGRDGWEVVSHDLAIYENVVILTFLARRPI